MTGLNAHKVSMDANRVCRGAQRRMLGGFLESVGADIHIAPAAVPEAVRQVVRAEEDHWLKQMGKMSMPSSRQAAVLDAVRQEAAAWARDMMKPGAIRGWQVHRLTQMARLAAARVRSNIPERCFRQRRGSATENDAEIISECAAAGFTALVSENVNSILHVPLNAWADRTRRESPDLLPHGFRILGSDEFIAAWIGEQDNPDDACRHVADVAIGLSLPDISDGLDTDIKAINGFLANLASRGAEMRRTADLTRASVRSERILEKRFRAVRMRLPAGSRETERVRMQRMEKAAKSEGWTP